MCGICGSAWLDSDSSGGLPDSSLDRMVERLKHRGPDDSGRFRDRNVALGFRRLSIVDLSGGHQPLSNEAGTVWTVFNGEIYNFPVLRRRLEARGHILRSTGDTEVLVHLYEDEGPGLFAHLRGMFALAIWDAPRRRLVVGRDRMGQKPLVYRLDPRSRRFTFASELKALLTLAEADVPRDVDPSAVDEYLTFGYIPAPATIFRGVRKLPPAHYAVWQDGKLALTRYWNPDFNRQVDRPLSEAADELRATLDDAVREQMVADVPLGAFLSGGVDSSIVVALMRRASDRPVKTFSIGFDDPAFDESDYAELVAKALGTEHRTFRVEPVAWEILPPLAEQFDEPFADSSALPTWLVARETRRHVTVALTGDAGDELFGGYDRYRAVALAARIDYQLPSALRGWLGGPAARSIPTSVKAKTKLRQVKRFLERVDLAPGRRYLGWVTMFDEPTRTGLYSSDFLDHLTRSSERTSGDPDPASVLFEALGAADRRDPVTQATVADLLTYLPGDLLVKVDLASMAHSLECRSPMLDHRVVELALAMPVDHKLRLRGGRSKVVLKAAFAHLIPPSILTRPKMGFGVPLDRWFRGALRDELRSVLLDPRTLARGLFRPESVESLIDDHLEGRRDHAYRLWALLMLELWFRHHVDPSP